MRKVKSKMLNVKSFWLTKNQNRISNNEQRILNYEGTPFFFFPKASLPQEWEEGRQAAGNQYHERRNQKLKTRN